VDADADLIGRLRAGDEAAFVEIVRRYQPRLLRLAETVVHSRAVAEEVTQDTWLAVTRGVERFEGRSSFKTWLFRICLNRARSAVSREVRAGIPDDDVGEHFDASGAWSSPPEPWSDQVDDRMVADKLAHRVHELLADLPPTQREVVLLRDVEELSAGDVASLLDVTDGHQRVLLHRGRARLRALLAAEMGRR
jgi:RNA polymerase sigma-70 factor, ECF subfamily